MHPQEPNKPIPTLLDQPRGSILKSRGKSPFYGVSDERTGNVLALKIVSKAGIQRAIHYHDIISPMDFNGESEITLFTSTIKVIINGHNLERLFDYIIQHRVMWLKEPQDSFEKVDEKDVEVTSVRFEED